MQEPLGPQSTSGERWQRRSRRIIGYALGLSLLIHLATFLPLQRIARHFAEHKQTKLPPAKITFKVAQPEKEMQTISTPQVETAPPKESNRLADKDHAAKEETKVAMEKLRPRSKSGPIGNSPKNQEAIPEPKKSNISPSKKAPTKDSAYAALMPRANELFGQVDAGYQEYIDEQLKLGDVVDLNTSEYRFIGYFTTLVRDIELVWTYPYEAAVRGMKGKVTIEWIIKKDGTSDRIRVVESSGFKMLDDAALEAVKLASPFAPLPEAFEKEEQRIKFRFTYALTGL